LAASPARQLLRDLPPWRLLAMLAGEPMEAAVQGMALALEPQEGAMRVHGQLEFQSAGRPGKDHGRN
jgi:hypothetical protein